jgi:hypothetical protein
MPAGRQLGLLGGAVAASMGVLALRAESIAAALPPCAFHSITGVPCPARGAGRAALALARFDLAGAFAASPLAATAWIGFIAGGLAAGAAALAGRALPEIPTRLPVWQRVTILAVVLVNWSYVIATH